MMVYKKTGESVVPQFNDSNFGAQRLFRLYINKAQSISLGPNMSHRNLSIPKNSFHVKYNIKYLSHFFRSFTDFSLFLYLSMVFLVVLGVVMASVLTTGRKVHGFNPSRRQYKSAACLSSDGK
jgi:hypothetical protein